MVNELNEAGGVAWTDIYHPNGNKISLTARATTPLDALVSLSEALDVAVDELGMFLSPPGAPQVKVQQERKAEPSGPAPDGEVPMFAVEKIEHLLTKNGQPMIKAYGGRFKKFGVTVWPEVYEKYVKPGDPGTEVQTPGLMAEYETNEKGNPSKVVKMWVDK